MNSPVPRSDVEPSSSVGARDRPLLLRHALWLSAIAFALHYAWENAQCSLFFIHGTGETNQLSMLRAAAGDVALTWLAQIAVAVVSLRWLWLLERWESPQWLSMTGVGLFLSVFVEAYAMARGRWSYTPITPRLPGTHIALVPILQLLSLFPLTFGLVAWRLRAAVLGRDQTALTRRRYDRVAPVYDAMEWRAERRFRRWRDTLWSDVGSGRVLEVGVGTGKNIPCHPDQAEVTAIDLSPAMLERARRRAQRLGRELRLEEADVQELPYPDASFDVAVATFVFCSVPDPVQGLRELVRVLVPGGRLFLLEHVISKRPVLGRLMRWLDPIAVRLCGFHVARDTVANVSAAGFQGIEVTDLRLDVFKVIRALAPRPQRR